MPESAHRGRLIGSIAARISSWSTRQLELTDESTRLRGFHAIRVCCSDSSEQMDRRLADLGADTMNERGQEQKVVKLALFKRRRGD